jgi:hypothetical protein
MSVALRHDAGARWLGRLRGIALLSCVLAGLSNQGSGETPAGAASPDDGRRTLGRLPINLGRGLVGVFHSDNLVPLLVGGTAAGGASLLDQDVRDSVANPGSGFGKFTETAGAWPSAVVGAGLFTAGRFAHGQRFRAMSYDLADAMIVTGGYTQLLKAAVGRERPDGSNNKSFPSGHASNAFSMATVLERHYGWKAGVPAYALASVIGYSRIVQDKHYLSDVVAGAALGYIVGRTVVRVNDRPLDRPPGQQGLTWSVSPLLARQAGGLEVSVGF